MKRSTLKVTFSLAGVQHNECYTSQYLNLVKIINNPCNMYKPDALYESEDESAIGYYSDDNEMITDHRIHTLDQSSDSSTEANTVLQNVRKRTRLILSSDDCDVADDEWNWTEEENIVNIKKFSETSGINPLVLRTFEENSTPLCVLKQFVFENPGNKYICRSDEH
ncbi:hypothetical protein NPIL_228781 [Nephila pilipes]|uniref:Uncharacterized protein n=1 Tax=Nephila pilipes TaxID=299642 RepID=A0A8X6P106_NEPPI|nr:hypothetical protein NPIL_228781 [Nephila pilipes]